MGMYDYTSNNNGNSASGGANNGGSGIPNGGGAGSLDFKHIWMLLSDGFDRSSLWLQYTSERNETHGKKPANL